MACTYCFYVDEIENRTVKSYGTMSLDTAYTLIDKALSSSDSVNFAFQGGEPTLMGLDFFKAFTSYAIEKRGDKVSFSLQTNGYNMTREWAKFFHDNNYLIGLSMDGNKKYHDLYRIDWAKKGTFTKAFRASNFLAAEKVDFNILITVTNEVAKNIEEVFNFFKRNNLRYLQFIPCIDPMENSNREYFLSAMNYGESLKKLFNLYYDSWKEKSYVSIRYFDNLVLMLLGMAPENCGMRGICGHYYVIEADGSVFPCDFYVLDDYKLGNISKDTFEDIDAARVALRFIEKSTKVENECKECKYYPLCRGGCRRDRENFSNGELELNYLCKAYKGFFDHAIDRLVIMAQAEARARKDV